MQIVIFDDQKIKNFYPLTLTRSTGDLRCGILKLRQRILSNFETDEINVIIPSWLQKLYNEKHPEWQINYLKKDETMFVNSRLIIDEDEKILDDIDQLKTGELLTNGKEIIACRKLMPEIQLNTESVESILKNEAIIVDNDSIKCFEYPWELIEMNGSFIRKDFDDYFYNEGNAFTVEMGVTVINPYSIWIGEGAILKPGVILDATDGPVVVDEGAKVLPNSVITGPAYIGKNSVIKALAKIYGGTSIGPVCKVGGEVEETIIQGYTNKQHDGFLGHSYLGEWINLGADTNNSDLKNNYTHVKNYFYPLKTKIDTGTIFMGALIGDHSKTSINSAINTGTVVGVGCNLFGNELIRDFVPSFTWGNCQNKERYGIDKFLETTAIVKSRRNLELSEAEKALYIKIASEELD